MRSLRSVSHTSVAARRLESPPFRAGSVNDSCTHATGSVCDYNGVEIVRVESFNSDKPEFFVMIERFD